MRSYCFMGTEFLLGNDEKILEVGSDDCRAL